MIARLQRFIVYLIVATLVGAAWLSLTAGSMVWIASASLLVAGSYLAVLGLEFWLLRRSYADQPGARPRDLELLRCWLTEVVSATRVFLWRQPFRSSAIADSPGGRGSPGGVVLVHGFVCNRGLWNPWMARLRRLEVPFVAVTLEPPFGSIDAYAGTVAAAVEALEASTGRLPILVGHSMGGLAIRAWLARRGDAGKPYRVLTIATPHHGTRLAQYSRTRNGREMGFDSPWLQALAGAEVPGVYGRFTCFWSRCDNIVFPTSTATLPGADNRHLPATPHVAMAYHPAIFDEVVRLARSGAPAG